ncbi:hypothetical protein ABL78_7342 [Leptomonas seymouri]|uniref:C3H1-type domain-containing protein n=1 Tax=Leptomonas seymouri TaxID=5684 RepID=A0A0N0P318_LEPSE|nr:hypothetical protein ABL78_7342 [Leptomonas seymouri]|eukprot:KPI83616.1 hypothetical protein ABL78_7342 [Leptomonas seymouri]
MNFDRVMQQWTVAKGVASPKSVMNFNALSNMETNMTCSPNSNTGASRSGMTQPVSAPFSLDPDPVESYSPSVYSVIDQIVREAMNGAFSPLSEDSNTAPHTPTGITPHGGEFSSHRSQQTQQQPSFLSHALPNVPTPHWITSSALQQPSSNFTENSLASNADYLDSAAPAWNSLSKQSSLQQPGLASPEPHVWSSVPQPLSVAAVGTVNNSNCCNSTGLSGTSTPAHQPSHFSSVVGSPLSPTSNTSSNHGNMEVVITGAVAAGAQPSSNAATHYKTKRCRHFDQSGWCPYQHRCVFAHGDREFAIYTARKNEATNGNHLKTSQQVKDHIARNVHQLVEEYEQAVAEAAANAKTKGATAATSVTPVTNISAAQSSSQVSSTTSQNSSVHLMTASPLAPVSIMTQTTNSNPSIPVFHYQSQQQPQPQQLQIQPQQQQQQFTVLSQPPIFISNTSNTGVQCAPLQFTAANAPVGTTFTVMPANTTMQAAQQPQQQPQFVFAVPSNTQGVYQLQPQQQQQQQQQVYVVEAPFFQTVQMNSNNAGSAAAMQQAQSSGSLHAYPSNGYVSTSGTAFGAARMIGRYA